MSTDAPLEVMCEFSEVIRELAPHFEVGSRDYPNFTQPRIIIWEFDGLPHYWCEGFGSSKPVISLPPSKVKPEKKVIAHELGHWYHHSINPKGYYASLSLGGLGKELEGAVREGIAFYSEICLGLGKGILDNPEFSLGKFSRMNPKQLVGERERLIRFYKEDILPMVIY